MSDSQNWYFSAETNAKGYTYIKAYQTKWDPVRKRSHSFNRRHVGRLHDDGRVVPSKAFLEQFPQYAGFPLFYGADKRLVDEETYRRDFPERPGPDRDIEEALKDDVLNVGAAWAIETLAEEAGLFRSLADIFGDAQARELLHLAIYKLDQGGSMAAYGEWWKEVYLKNASPLSDQRISELLSAVSIKDFEEFFRLRHAAKLDKAKAEDVESLTYALDNTSISAYSKTIGDAAYGHAKRDPDLKQINYTFVCDQKDGEIVFAYTYEGSINDAAALKEIIYRMRAADLDLSNVTLVTDRGYSSLQNVQKMINLELKFIQGVRIVEDVMKLRFDEYRESFRDIGFYDAETRAYARTVKESWKLETDSGTLNKELFVHLYRFPGADEDEMTELAARVAEILKFKAENRDVPPELWRTYRRYIKELPAARAERNVGTAMMRPFVRQSDMPGCLSFAAISKAILLLRCRHTKSGTLLNWTSANTKIG
ncbi:hypothetical protein HMPREF1476_01505 [Sutterella wadsworthensis HGA0223]|uniref:Transposase IS4-like domain-containing protein n=1 Tax=Sutterella wadsworthensis HGA0223 TaxID=1203554 RepID=S3BBS5_9BURK|nr:transposase [Sutterella wadsworthensis]EPD98763.1 hypothetical protein HMPREF1476_01505 [Sutterella wadsworthensis HGA0223]